MIEESKQGVVYKDVLLMEIVGREPARRLFLAYPLVGETAESKSGLKRTEEDACGNAAAPILQLRLCKTWRRPSLT